jgi:hypothetical protein
MQHGRRQILWLGVTAHPTAEWIARQLTEACGWEWNPRYLVRDRDRVYGECFTRRLRAMGRSTADVGAHRCKTTSKSIMSEEFASAQPATEAQDARLQQHGLDVAMGINLR